MMLQRIMKNVIEESNTEQLTEMYYEFVKANSLRAAQGIGTDETLSEMVAEVVAEMNNRMSGGQDTQLPPAT
jgi:biotin carboxylase